MADNPGVRVFFYGSFINRDVLARGGVTIGNVDVVTLWGFDIRIHTLATLVPSDRHCVYGILCQVAPAQLERLYAQTWLGASYVPQAVIVETRPGHLVPALCFIAQTPPARPADDYLSWILSAARELAFPEWYIRRLERAGRTAPPED